MFSLARALAVDTGLCAVVFATATRAAVYSDYLSPVADQIINIFGTVDPSAKQVSDVMLQFNVRCLLNDRLALPVGVSTSNAHLCVIVDYAESTPRALSTLDTRSPQHTLIIVRNA